jgi:hypothetical protein
MFAEANRRLWVGVMAALVLALVGVSCGDGGDFLLDEEPTETPFFTRTPAVGLTVTPGPTITPGATTRPEATVTPEAAMPEATTPSVEVTPVAGFEITVKEAVNIRAAPTTGADLIGGDSVIYPGHRRTVIGQARGEEVEEGSGDLWYALEDGGFVYAPFVEEVATE